MAPTSASARNINSLVFCFSRSGRDRWLVSPTSDRIITPFFLFFFYRVLPSLCGTAAALTYFHPVVLDLIQLGRGILTCIHFRSHLLPFRFVFRFHFGFFAKSVVTYLTNPSTELYRVFLFFTEFFLPSFPASVHRRSCDANPLRFYSFKILFHGTIVFHSLATHFA